MKRIIINLMLLLPAIAIQAASPTAYRIFDSKGAETDFDTMVDSLSRADAVFIGENHNCPISHWMELEISRALFQRHGSDLVIGQEMMEADNQLILDEYMAWYHKLRPLRGRSTSLGQLFDRLLSHGLLRQRQQDTICGHQRASTLCGSRQQRRPRRPAAS